MQVYAARRNRVQMQGESLNPPRGFMHRAIRAVLGRASQTVQMYPRCCLIDPAGKDISCAPSSRGVSTSCGGRERARAESVGCDAVTALALGVDLDGVGEEFLHFRHALELLLDGLTVAHQHQRGVGEVDRLGRGNAVQRGGVGF